LVRRTASFTRRILTGLVSALGIFALASCTNNPAQPTQEVTALKLGCPVPLAIGSPSGQPATVSYLAATITGGTPPSTVTCSPASGAIFPVGVTTVNCTGRDQVGRTDACAFTITVIGPPRLTVTRFLAFGDSITWGEDGRNSSSSLGLSLVLRPRVQFPTSDTYPGALQVELSARYTAQTPQVMNAGNPGEFVTGPATFPRFTSLVSSGQYDVVLLMEGANDLSINDTPDVIAGLGQMIDYAKNHGMTVFLATIPPENPAGVQPQPRGVEYGEVPPFNDQVRALAAAKDVTLVDVYNAFNGDLTLIGNDGLHPTAAGYHLIADTFFASIRQVLEAPASATSSSNRLRMPARR
jgi:lysophospholipase L1-like esterase